MDLLDAVSRQAQACADLGSPLYAGILRRVAEDITAGGVFRDVLAGHEDDPGPSALALRLLGSVHRLVLDGTAARLAAFYPTTGGHWDPDDGWRAFEWTVREHGGAVRARLHRPPQTNEVGRGAALMGGLTAVAAGTGLPVRLFEIGSSAGLNLLADQYCYTDERGRRRGRLDSPVLMRGAWAGRDLPDVEPRVIDRLGSDVAPVDVSSEDGRLTLLSYVWPDQQDRWTRLQDAFTVARVIAAPVVRRDARSFVDGIELADGSVTVLWHSVMWQYLDDDDREAIRHRIRRLGAQATARRPFAHLVLEPARRTAGREHEFLVLLTQWPGGERRVLGTAAPHGIPTTWE